jgi:3-hydroxy acid dehydrogenase / malonic semialdehyde reductase
MALSNQNVLITGASMGIGASIAESLAKENANLILLARSEDKLVQLAGQIRKTAISSIKIFTRAVDVGNSSQVNSAVEQAVQELGPLDIVVNNAGLAIGAPNAFPELKLEDITTMTNTNIHGMMFTTYAALNAGGMRERGRGTILNITSVTGLEAPPFPGEAVYHTCKAAQEAFTNALRIELVGTRIRVLALRPGVVATHFHQQRVGYDQAMYDEFTKGYEPLVADEVAEAALFMLRQRESISVKALDVVPTAQRSLAVFNRGSTD